MADSEAKEAAAPDPEDLKSASSPDNDPGEVETLKNISAETGDFTEKEVENQEKEKENINNQTTPSSQHEASIKPDKEGISKELSQNNVDADTTTTKNNNKSTENIVQEEKSGETEEKDENKKSESDLSDISSKNPEIIVEAADNEEKKGLYT